LILSQRTRGLYGSASRLATMPSRGHAPDRGRGRAAQLALVDGDSGLVFAPGGQPRVVVDFVLENGRIVEINMIGEAERIAALDLEF